MLKAAADRGVKVYIIVYKEVEAALSLMSSHTRTALEALHPNIYVFRHPDHYPTGYDLQHELGKTVKALTSFDLFKASGDALKAVYGTAGDVVLYWAHHEKLLVIDNGKIGFMGGLDMCMNSRIVLQRIYANPFNCRLWKMGYKQYVGLIVLTTPMLTTFYRPPHR